MLGIHFRTVQILRKRLEKDKDPRAMIQRAPRLWGQDEVQGSPSLPTEKTILLSNQDLSICKISRRLLEQKSTVARAFKCYKENGTLDDKPKGHRRRAFQTPRLIKCIKERIRRNPKCPSHRPMRHRRNPLGEVSGENNAIYPNVKALP
ncbi:unnamed protein product [Lepeophtheirus salmonis]|uniref:(salmon louse) hypothetical protein n=1 Tax=Lepeophtheirus salmonis TaxID=72036 RepID=A0A7R8CCM2_LEPSM|nr:unnamed protein product [Lepeophtheirus salmonis]CAF2772647.1 unnamed protein product [Lepeophtheirus salmonis]